MMNDFLHTRFPIAAQRMVFCALRSVLLAVFLGFLFINPLAAHHNPVKIAISQLKVFETDPMLSKAADAFPVLMKTPFLPYNWIEIVSTSEIGEFRYRAGQRVRPEAFKEKDVTREQLLESQVGYWLRGRFYRKGDEISFYPELIDVKTNEAIYSDYLNFRQERLLSSLELVADKVVSLFKQIQNSAAGEEETLLFAVERFQNPGNNRAYQNLQTIFPQELMSNLSILLDENNMQFIRLNGPLGTPLEQPEHYDVRIAGTYQIQDSLLQLSVLFSDIRDPFEVTVQLEDNLIRTFELPGRLARRIMEIINARFAPDGRRRAVFDAGIGPDKQELLKTGWSYFRQRNYESAALIFRKMLENFPNAWEAYYGLGRVYALTRDPDEALQNFREALKADSNRAEVHMALGKLYLESDQAGLALIEFKKVAERPNLPDSLRFQAYFAMGQLFQQSGDDLKALQYYQQAQELNDQKATVYLALAELYEGKNDYLKAEEYLLQGRRFAAESSTFNNRLGEIYRKKAREYFEEKQYERTLKTLDKILLLPDVDNRLLAYAYSTKGFIIAFYVNPPAVKEGIRLLKESVPLDPENEWPYTALGGIYLSLGDANDAIANLEKSVQIRETQWAYSLLGESYRQARLFRPALESLNKALEINPGYTYVYLTMGKTLYDMGNYERAMQRFKSALELDSSYAEAYAELGNTYMEIGAYPEAIASLRNAIRINPQYEWAYQILGMTYLNTRDYGKAVEVLQTALRINHSAWSYSRLGKAYLLLGDYRKAVDNLNRALQLEPDNVFAKNMLGLTYKELGRFNLAAATLQEAIALEPSSWNYGQLGAVYYEKGESNRALEYLQQALALDSLDALIYVTLGKVYKDNGQFSKAERAYRKAIGIEHLPDDSVALAELYITWGKLGPAVAILKKVVAAHPDSPSGYRALGMAYKELKDYPRAIENLNKASELQPDSWVIYSHLGEVYYLQGMHEEAQRFLRRSIALKPDDAYNHYLLALIYTKNEAYAQAEEILNKALNIRPAALLYQQMGEVYYLQRKFGKAIRQFQTAIALDSSRAVPYRMLGLCYKQQQDYPRASQAFLTSLRLRPTAWAYLQVGEIFYLSHDDSAAVRYLKKSLEMDSSKAYTYRVLGLSYKGLKRYREAIAAFRKSLELEPSSVALIQLGDLFLKSGETDSSIYYSRRAIEMNPRSALAFQTIARAFLQARDIPSAVNAFQRSAEISPTADLYRELGETYYNSNNFPEALKAFQESIELNREYVAGYRWLGLTYQALGEFEKALEAFNFVLETAPDTWTYIRLAEVYQGLGQYSNSEEFIQRALEQEPQNAYLYRLSGSNFEKAGDFKRAITAYEQAVVLEASAWTLAHLGNAYYLSGKFEKALQLCRQAIEKDPDYKWAYQTLALILRERGDYDGAIAHLEKSTEFGATPWDYYRMADVYRLKQAYNQALEKIEKALELDSENIFAYETRLQIYYDMNSFEHCMETIEKLLSMDAENAYAHQIRGVIYHDSLFQYQKSYQDFKFLYERNPNDLSNFANFIESNLTSGRFKEANRLANQILVKDDTASTRQLDVQQRLTMRFIAIASLILLNRDEQAHMDIGEFIRYYEYLPENFAQTWSYNGTKHFIKNYEMKETSRDLILKLIGLLEEKKSPQRIREFKSYLFSIR